MKIFSKTKIRCNGKNLRRISFFDKPILFYDKNNYHIIKKEELSYSCNSDIYPECIKFSGLITKSDCINYLDKICMESLGDPGICIPQNVVNNL